MAKPTTTPSAESTALAVVTPTDALAAIKTAIATIPEADEDPTERMIAHILSHPPEEWEQLWTALPNVKENAGRSVEIHALRVRPSDFEGPLGVYLVADVTWLDTGEKGLLTCSSQISMVQLVRLYAERKLPARVQIVAKDKPTRAGRRPIHLRYLGAVEAPLGDPGAVVSEQ